MYLNKIFLIFIIFDLIFYHLLLLNVMLYKKIKNTSFNNHHLLI